MSQDLDQILDEAITAVQGGESVEACLARYPQHANELAPLLVLAGDLCLEAEAPLPPAMDAWLLRGQMEFDQVVAQTLAPKPAAARAQRAPWWRGNSPLRLAAALVVALFLVLGTTAVNTAAAASLPGDTLYSLKLVGEAVRLAFTPNPEQRASLQLEYAEERSDEVAELLERREASSEQVKRVAELFQQRVHDALEEAQRSGSTSQVQSRIVDLLSNANDMLDSFDRLPPEQQAAAAPFTETIASLQAEITPTPQPPAPTATGPGRGTQAGNAGTASSPTNSTTQEPTATLVREPGAVPAQPEQPAPTSTVTPASNNVNEPAAPSATTAPTLQAEQPSPPPTQPPLPTNAGPSATPATPAATTIPADTPVPTAPPLPSPTDLPIVEPTSLPPLPTEPPTRPPRSSPTPSATAAPVITNTAAPTATPTGTEAPTPTETETPTATPTETATPTPTETETATPTETDTPTPTETPGSTNSISTPTPTSSPEPTVEPTEIENSSSGMPPGSTQTPEAATPTSSVEPVT